MNRHPMKNMAMWLKTILLVAALGSFAAPSAFAQTGTVMAWGNNSWGQTTIPAGLSGVTAIAAGYLHTVALKSDGTVVAWGFNDYGQTTLPAGLSGVEAIAAGWYHTVALKSDGTVVAWGNNSFGTTTIPAGLSGVTAIAAGAFHTVALFPDNVPPTVPTGLTASAISASQINLSWTASTDNVRVTAYKVYRGGILLATLGNVTSYSNTGLTSATAYSYTVAACDAGANCSAQSTAVSVTTPAAMAANYAGTFSGTYSGGDSGTWALTVSSTGVITMAGYSNSLGVAVTGSGQVSSNGSLTMAAGSVSTGATFIGSINPATGAVSGTWTNNYYGISGIFTGSMNTTNANYAGTYSGSYSGGDSGTWTTIVSSMGALTMTGYSNNLQSAVTGSGQVSSNGSLTMTAGSVSTGANFYGTISPLTGAVSGTWVNNYYGISGSFSGSSATTPASDTTVPSVPSGLSATVVSSSQVNLSWTASTDNVGVTSYKVYRGGALLATLSNVTSYNNTGLTSATAYSYRVTACDAAANCSAQSTTAAATTQASTTPSPVITCVSPQVLQGGVCVTPVVMGDGSLNLVVGWNLLGNSVNAPLVVADNFANAVNITTVWKWILATSKWAFYAPTLIGQALTDYAATKGYDVLTTINGGEGFWVNAKTTFTAQLPAGTAISTPYFQDQLNPAQNKLILGWNLIATGDNKTPSEFNKLLSVTPPAIGVVPLNVTTLWAWDSGLMNWYFYAPILEANGGLTNYITSKGYLDFGSKTLTPTTGFWVNKP